jgi:hypothetical protein
MLPQNHPAAMKNGHFLLPLRQIKTLRKAMNGHIFRFNDRYFFELLTELLFRAFVCVYPSEKTPNFVSGLRCMVELKTHSSFTMAATR